MRNHHIRINISIDQMGILVSSNSTLNSQEKMFFGLNKELVLKVEGVEAIQVGVDAEAILWLYLITLMNPNDVLRSPISPLT